MVANSFSRRNEHMKQYRAKKESVNKTEQKLSATGFVVDTGRWTEWVKKCPKCAPEEVADDKVGVSKNKNCLIWGGGREEMPSSAGTG